MSDIMRVQPFPVLLDWILTEFEERESIFGIHRSLFYTPSGDEPYSTAIFGHHLATPIGPGAGPHTQLAQNIVAAWLSGGRFIELKTVQIMDELEIPRPCIDMEDEGYNVEWSQELKLSQSVGEYVKAWVLIHVLRRLLGFEHLPWGTVFNMSIGYDLAGIQSEPMTRFMDILEDASVEIEVLQETLRRDYPQFADLEIPARLTDNVTLSTMHGCPPDEIEQIGRYLLEERHLHTTVKLNPTLLGKERVLDILHNHLGFTAIEIPDRVFDHDLQYDRAVSLIHSLQEVAAREGLTFGVKLSNTLAMANHKGVLPGDEMYMSGRALFPVTINLFHTLAQEFGGDLNVSYSAGADALNLPDILAAGALPVTAVSDLLKPGGYSRFLQYLENLASVMEERGADSLAALAADKLAALERLATQSLESPRYKKGYHPYGLPKVESALGLFDCVTAPCVERCPIQQDVPEYAWLISQGEYDRAFEVILARNPLPGVTGYICTHVCQTRCTRNNYDEPVAIRALKRFAFEHGREPAWQPAPSTGRRVAVIGSGPSGLSAAYFLALNGVDVTIYEARDRAGGMAALAPAFRLPDEVLAADVARIERLGVQIELSHPVTAPPEELLGDGFDAVYIATGAQLDARLGLDGEDGVGVYHVLAFLEQVRHGERPDLGRRVLVIGGGNSAMDAARTARRLTGGDVTILYRRTRAEMPADDEEIRDALAEGVTLEELVSPVRFILDDDGRFVALECIRNRLGEPGPDGRRRPEPLPGSEFRIPADGVVVAIGQRPDLTFLDGSTLAFDRRGALIADPESGAVGSHLYAGGDAVRGPATIVEAAADGRRAAAAICRQLGGEFTRPEADFPTLTEEDIIARKMARARRVPQVEPDFLPLEHRLTFDLVEPTLTEAQAQAEANRCLQCSAFCDKCVEVCPNRANYTYFTAPVDVTLPLLSCREGRLASDGTTRFRIAQTRQIIHVDDFCNQCGNCTTFCVHQGKPYLDKPRLFLREEDFVQEEDNAFYIARQGADWLIRRREGGHESRLTLHSDGSACFEDEHLTLTFAPGLAVEGYELKAEFAGTFSPATAAEMAVILKGVVESAPYLLPRRH